MPANASCDNPAFACVDVLMFIAGELLTRFALPCIFSPGNVPQTHFAGCTLSLGDSLHEMIAIPLRQPTCFIK